MAMERSTDTVYPGTTASEQISREELQLATRNHGMPLEALRYPVTPAGLHYVLTHYDVPAVDPASWRLVVDGSVDRGLALSLDDLRQRPSVTRQVTMECAGNGRARLSPRPLSQPWLLEAVGSAEWTGTPLRPLLEEAGLSSGAVELVFSGLDQGIEGGVEQRYQRSLTVAETLQRDDLLLAWAMNDQPLPPQHGFPLRLVVPGWYGMASVKWLARITATEERFAGYQHVHAYRYRLHPDEPGRPVTRIAPRSLLVPPGIPEFMSRRRFVPLAPCRLEGRAWSGWGPIAQVEVSADGGRTWEPAELDPPAGPHAWQRWSAIWEPAEPGDYELCCRATDASGRGQPTDPQWNLGGYADNDVHRVAVTVTPPVTAR
jgi:DMSO/TMAO reductase YedYZ molybdopterin-dependent catalytic subunit